MVYDTGYKIQGIRYRVYLFPTVQKLFNLQQEIGLEVYKFLLKSRFYDCQLVSQTFAGVLGFIPGSSAVCLYDAIRTTTAITTAGVDTLIRSRNNCKN